MHLRSKHAAGQEGFGLLLTMTKRVSMGPEVGYSSGTTCTVRRGNSTASCFESAKYSSTFSKRAKGQT